MDTDVSKWTQMMPPLAYKVIKGHNSRTVKVKLPKIELKLSLEVISIIFNIRTQKFCGRIKVLGYL